MSEVKLPNKMNIKEFRELGLLVELNRTFLHPLGLALGIIFEDDGTEKIGGIWDYRDNPEGMLYGKGCFPTGKSKKAREFIKTKHNQRLRALGFVYQDPDNPQYEKTTFGSLLLGKKEARMLLKAGGCPANNTRCKFLKSGLCEKKWPELYEYYSYRKFACGNFEWM